MSVSPLPPERLCRSADPEHLRFRSSEEVPPSMPHPGQPRAAEAIRRSAELNIPGSHLFVAGDPGTGRERMVRELVGPIAASRPVPCDLVYVFNFDDPEHPVSIELPAGTGKALARAMEEFIETAQRDVPQAFETEDYEHRLRDRVSRIRSARKALVDRLHAFARSQEVKLEAMHNGFVSVPLRGGQPIPTEEFGAMGAEEKKRVTARARDVQKLVHTTIRELRALDKDEETQTRELDREIARFTTGPLLDELKERFGAHGPVVRYLKAVQEDLLDHLQEFRAQPEPENPELARFLAPERVRGRPDPRLNRYRVNVLVDNSSAAGAPVIFERNPTYYNLFGRVSYRASFGTMVTDFMEVEPGSVHRANGGYLVLEALDLMRSPFSWDALKRTLLSGSARIENLGDQYMMVPAATLRPEPVLAKVKVILIGSPMLYALLFRHDEEFRSLFKLRADLASEMNWNAEGVAYYASYLGRTAREHGLRHFDRDAVARLVEFGGRVRESQKKLTTRLDLIRDVAAEAHCLAGSSGRRLVALEDVEGALARREFRSNLYEERLRELIAEGTLRITVSGQRIGEINGLAVLNVGEYAFGKPNRITATVSLGKGDILSIERETKLSGPIHSKGFMILSGFLRSRYALDFPLALSAMITFEQSYDEVEGDSASSTELYALLSALSEVPLRQGVAVTGSCDQHGEIQAVGGINEKIEGYFATCRVLEAPGIPAVLIPASNTRNLMLRREVREAARRDRFRIYPVATLDEGLELLTGRPAASVHARVAGRLRDLAEKLRSYAREVQVSDNASLPSIRRAA